jgi:SPP1 family predicted phage head-tail adaptor
MRAGTMRDRVTLQRWTPDNDPTWGPAQGWTNIVDLWASVTPASGTEKPDGQGVQTTITHHVSMRYRSDVTSKDRLIYRGRTLDIVSVIDVDGLRAELAIEAREHPQEQ